MDNDQIVDLETNKSQESVVLTSINKAINTVRKGGVAIVIVPGEATFSYDVPTYRYSNDNDLHPWVKAALENHVILLIVDDIKIQKVIEIGRELHFDLFTILDFPEQKVSGSAYSMLSALGRILHSELEMFGRVKSANIESPKEIDDQQESPNLSDSNEAKFDSVLRKL